MFVVSSSWCFRPIHWNQVLSREWRCSWSSTDRRCSNCILMIQQLHCLLRCAYTRGLTELFLYNHLRTFLSKCWTSCKIITVKCIIFCNQNIIFCIIFPMDHIHEALLHFMCLIVPRNGANKIAWCKPLLTGKLAAIFVIRWLVDGYWLVRV